MAGAGPVADGCEKRQLGSCKGKTFTVSQFKLVACSIAGVEGGLGYDV